MISSPRPTASLTAMLVLVLLAGGGDIVPSWAQADPQIWFTAGPSMGAFEFDDELALYRWDAAPALIWGGQALAGHGSFAAGLRAWRTATAQSSGIPGETARPDVRLTGVELLAQARVWSPLGFELWTSAQLGRLHLGYEPDRLVFVPLGGGEGIEVDYTPIDEWTRGMGLELRRQLIDRMALALQVDYTSFALDTAHRSGDTIVESRDRFGSWSFRLGAGWQLGGI